MASSPKLEPQGRMIIDQCAFIFHIVHRQSCIHATYLQLASPIHSGCHDLADTHSCRPMFDWRGRMNSSQRALARSCSLVYYVNAGCFDYPQNDARYIA